MRNCTLERSSHPTFPTDPLFLRLERRESLLFLSGLRDDIDRRVVCEGTRRVVNISCHSTAVASGVLLESQPKEQISDVT